MENKRLRAFLAGAVFAALIFPSVAFADIGSIANLSGTVYSKPSGAGKWSVAVKGSGVNTGDRVKTAGDGRVLLKLDDGTNLTLGNDSELEITEYLFKKNKRSAVFSLSSGKVRTAVGKFNGSTDIKVKTPTSVSGVKGTDFIVMNSGPANVIFGEESTVQVSGESGKPVDLKPNTVTENTAGTSPIKPEKVEPGTPLAEARAQLEAITNVDAPVDWVKAGKLPFMLARWNINYGHYLTESKNFTSALDVLQIAIDLTDAPELRAKAHIERGTVLAKNLNESVKALAEYMTVIDKYPATPSLPNALYSAGAINKELGKKDEAKRLFERYLTEFPKGSHRGTIEIFMKDMDKN